MKSTKSPEEIELSKKSSDPQTGLKKLQAREPGRAFVLSLLFPGLGQLFNKEFAKGYLFIGVSVANLLLISLLFGTEAVLNALVSFAALFNCATKINVQHALEIVQTGRAITLLYLALILSFDLYAARDAYDRALEKRRGKEPPRYKLSMPEATSGSYIFHFSVICALIVMVIFFIAPPKPQVQTTDIELMQEIPKPPAPEKKQPEPPKPKAKLESKKVELPPKKVTPTPPKPTPVAVAVKTDTPVPDPVVQSDEPAPPADPAPQEGSPNGSPNGTGAPNASGGGGGGDGDEVDFGSYLAEVQKRIKRNWFPPRGAESLTLTLKFKVLKDGKLGGIKLVRSSGIAAADDAAKTAITNSAPFPPLPKGAGDDVDIKFTFDYNVFSGKLKGL